LSASSDSNPMLRAVIWVPFRETACGSFGASAPDAARGRAMDSEAGGVYLIAVQDLVLLFQRALRSSQRVILATVS